MLPHKLPKRVHCALLWALSRQVALRVVAELHRAGMDVVIVRQLGQRVIIWQDVTVSIVLLVGLSYRRAASKSDLWRGVL